MCRSQSVKGIESIIRLNSQYVYFICYNNDQIETKMLAKDWLTMATRYVREFGFKDTLTDSEALIELNFMIEP